MSGKHGVAAPRAADAAHATHITITQGMSGYFAVMVWWNPDMGGFWEPYDTGTGRYSTAADAEPEAMQWARDEGIKYVVPKQ